MERWNLGPIYHPEKGQPYHQVNSLRGIQAAKRAGYHWIDLDDQPCWRDSTYELRIGVNTHWPRPLRMDGFVDPLGELDDEDFVHDMTWAEVSRLRTRSGRYIIRPTTAQYASAARARVNVMNEKKAHLAYTELGLHEREHAKVLQLRERHPRFRVVVGTLSTSRLAGGILEAAKEAGRTTVLLAHSDFPASWVKHADYVRGDGKPRAVR